MPSWLANMPAAAKCGAAHSLARLARAESNHAGGVIAGISTGAPLLCRAAFKPVSTHFLPQQTLNKAGEAVSFHNRGRHDPCVLPRAVPLVESAVLLTLADHALLTEALWGGSSEG